MTYPSCGTALILLVAGARFGILSTDYSIVCIYLLRHVRRCGSSNEKSVFSLSTTPFAAVPPAWLINAVMSAKERTAEEGEESGLAA